ncbi:MAG: ISAs1 family transposase [Thermoguttaceae bacterium]
MPNLNSLEIFVDSLNKIPDPRSKYGTSHPFTAAFAVVFLGLLANLSTLAEIQRWAEIHFSQLKQYIEFKDKKGKRKIPHAITFARILRKISLQDLQNAFAEFINAILPTEPLVAAVDGKVAKQMKNEEGDPILMLNVFAQQVKLHLASWSVRGDKTNEPGCLKQHLEELFEMYPCLKLLTGDAIYAQRPLLEAIQEYHCDYLVQIKENQPKVLEQMKLIFEDVPKQEPSDRKVEKKGEMLKFVVCG